MRNLILSALLLSAFPLVSLGQVTTIGQFSYDVENGGATITASSATGAVTFPSELGGYAVKKVGNSPTSIFGPNTSVTSVVIPDSVTSIGSYAFMDCRSLANITIPNSVTSIGDYAFDGCTSLISIIIPNSVTSIGAYAFNRCTSLTSATIGNSVTSIGHSAFRYCTSLTSITIPFYADFNVGMFSPFEPTTIVTRDYTSLVTRDDFINALVIRLASTLASNDAFVTAVANKIKETGGNYGIATQSGLSSAITTAVEPLATKTELTSSLTQSRTDGINSVLSNPNLWTLYTTSQIQNMAVGDLVLTKNVGGTFTLNYDIEQSTDLQTWTTYAPLSLPLTGLPTDKAFVRIKAKGAEVLPPPPTNNAGGGDPNNPFE